jgi:thioredoxin domain-containing protein 5
MALWLLVATTLSSVTDMTDANHDEVIRSATAGAFVKFYAPWCGHCRKLEPTWEALSDALQPLPAATAVARVDCTKHRALCSRYGIRSFPTLLFFADEGKSVRKHESYRTLDALTAFASGGWRDAPEYDPTAVPERPAMTFAAFKKALQASPMLVVMLAILVGGFCLLVATVACGCCDEVFDDDDDGEPVSAEATRHLRSRPAARDDKED